MKPRIEISFPITKQNTFWRGTPYIPKDGEFLLNHARSGILIALKSLTLPPGSDVGVMAYNCHTVFNAVAQAGCHPVFIDITDDLRIDFDDLRKKESSIKALVVTHLFGHVNDINRIREEFPGLYIVEDCAHAVGISSLNGDFAVFSIGQGKLPTLGDGGILRVLNSAFLESTVKLYRLLPEYSFLDELKLFLKLLFKSVLYLPCVYGCLRRVIKKIRPETSGIETVSLRKMSRGVMAIYKSEYPSMGPVLQRRKAQASAVEASLGHIPGVVNVIEGSINGFMAVCECSDKTRVQGYLRKLGIDSATHFSDCIHWAVSFGYTKGECPTAEDLVHRLLMVPTY